MTNSVSHTPTPEQLLSDPLDKRGIEALRTAFAWADHTTQLLVGLIDVVRTELGESDGAELAIMRDAAQKMSNAEAREMAL